MWLHQTLKSKGNKILNGLKNLIKKQFQFLIIKTLNVQLFKKSYHKIDTKNVININAFG